MKKRPVLPFVSDISPESKEAWLTHLQAALPEVEIVAYDDVSVPTNTEVAIVANPNAKLLANMQNLKWVQSLWAGVETLVNTLPQDIDIVRMTDPQLAKTMAEAVLTMTLFLHRDLPRYAAQQSAGIWKQHAVKLPQDRRVGVLGLGALGQDACKMLSRQGFEVLGWSKRPKTIDQVKCFSGDDGLLDLLKAADIVVVLLPLTDETRGLLNAERLLQMKQGASVINFARAQIIETDALLEQLDKGHLNHAVLDVFATEPLPKDDRLWRGENITVLPHVSAPTNMQTASIIVANNIRSFFETKQVPPCVDRTHGY